MQFILGGVNLANRYVSLQTALMGFQAKNRTWRKNTIKWPKETKMIFSKLATSGREQKKQNWDAKLSSQAHLIFFPVCGFSRFSQHVRKIHHCLTCTSYGCGRNNYQFRLREARKEGFFVGGGLFCLNIILFFSNLPIMIYYIKSVAM